VNRQFGLGGGCNRGRRGFTRNVAAIDHRGARGGKKTSKEARKPRRSTGGTHTPGSEKKEIREP